MSDSPRYFIVGGAGFIGSHFTDRLLDGNSAAAVTLYDNFSSGREWHYERHRNDPRFKVVRGDVNDLNLLTASMSGHDVVIHLASNPAIARAATGHRFSRGHLSNQQRSGSHAPVRDTNNPLRVREWNLR